MRKRKVIRIGFCVSKPYGCGRSVEIEVMTLSERNKYRATGICERCQTKKIRSSYDEEAALERERDRKEDAKYK